MKALKINSSTFTVHEVDHITDDSGVALAGEISFYAKTIKVIKELCPETRRQTVIHEVIHAISQEYGLEISEENTERIGNAFYAFLIDNKSFIKEIVK